MNSATVGFTLTPEDHATLEQWRHSQTLGVLQVRRARALLLLEQGYTVGAVARVLGVHTRDIVCWVHRFQAAGLRGLLTPAEARALAQEVG